MSGKLSLMSLLPKIQKIFACLQGKKWGMQNVIFFLILAVLLKDWCGLWAKPVSLGFWRINSFGFVPLIPISSVHISFWQTLIDVSQKHLLMTSTGCVEEHQGVWLDNRDFAGCPPVFLCPHVADIKLHSLKKPSRHAKQRPSHAAAVILCPLILPGQLSYILWFVRFVNSRQIWDGEKKVSDTKPAWMLLRTSLQRFQGLFCRDELLITLR